MIEAAYHDPSELDDEEKTDCEPLLLWMPAEAPESVDPPDTPLMPSDHDDRNNPYSQ
ncbi:hypothetical protein ACFL2Q_19440 [Thermodesulfobacteriota bacterium]